MKMLLLFLMLSLMTACSSTSETTQNIADSAPAKIPVDIAAIPDAIPRFEPRSRSVNPKSYKVLGKRYYVLSSSKGYLQKGIASWYGTKFHGKKTSNGEIYNMYGMTAAHKSLPIPSYARVTNLHNHRSIVVRINDRGPFHENRIIDLSYAAAVKLDIQKSGTGFVEVQGIEPGHSVSGNLPVAPDAGLVYLQVGAFSNRFNALELKKRIHDLQPTEARIQLVDAAGSSLYKLQLGPISSVAEADQLNSKLANIGINKTHYIIEKSSDVNRMIQ